MKRLILAPLLALALSGCFPIPYLLRPGISGFVADDATGAPVPNATVILSRLGRADYPLIATITDAEGRFVFAPRHALGIYFVPEDVSDFLGTVDIYASGYMKVSRDVRSNILGKTTPIVLGEIRVQRPP